MKSANDLLDIICVHLESTENPKGATMKKTRLAIILPITMSMCLLMAVSSYQPSDELIWTDRGCDATYTVGEPITVYFIPHDGEEFELWSFDAVMNAQLFSEGVGDGQTLSMTVTAEPPPGPLTFVLRMPCAGECQICDMCDHGQCSVIVEALDPCQDQDHCTNGVQDCGEYGVDCGSGCPVKDADQDGVEDCMDLCPHSLCDKVDADGCETDTDSDGVTDCKDDCPDRKGDPSNKGCPGSMNVIVILGGIAVVLVGGLVLWKVKGRSTGSLERK